MPTETLLTAARRVVREFNIMMHEGGLTNKNLEQAFDTLDKYVRREVEEEKRKVKINHVLEAKIDFIGEKFDNTKKSYGWYIRLEGLNESFFISETEPDLYAGDKLKITLERIKT